MNRAILCAILAVNVLTAQTNADVKAVYAKDSKSYTPLHIAAAHVWADAEICVEGKSSGG